MRQCISFPGYSVDEQGSVTTHRRRFGKGKGKGGGVVIDPEYKRLLTHTIGTGGYPYVSISISGKQRSIPVHVLMADAFIGPRPGGMEVLHSDGNPLNFNPSNLSYGTVRRNASDRIRHGTQPSGETHGRAVLNDAEVRSIRRLTMKGETIAAIARRLGVGESTVRDVVKGRKWTHVQ